MSCLSRLFLGVGAQGSWLWSGGMFTDFFLDDVVFFVAEVSLGSPICSNVWLECFFFDPVFRKPNRRAHRLVERAGLEREP